MSSDVLASNFARSDTVYSTGANADPELQKRTDEIVNALVQQINDARPPRGVEGSEQWRKDRKKNIQYVNEEYAKDIRQLVQEDLTIDNRKKTSEETRELRQHCEVSPHLHSLQKCLIVDDIKMDRNDPDYAVVCAALNRWNPDDKFDISEGCIKAFTKQGAQFTKKGDFLNAVLMQALEYMHHQDPELKNAIIDDMAQIDGRPMERNGRLCYRADQKPLLEPYHNVATEVYNITPEQYPSEAAYRAFYREQVAKLIGEDYKGNHVAQLDIFILNQSKIRCAAQMEAVRMHAADAFAQLPPFPPSQEVLTLPSSSPRRSPVSPAQIQMARTMAGITEQLRHTILEDAAPPVPPAAPAEPAEVHFVSRPGSEDVVRYQNQEGMEVDQAAAAANTGEAANSLARRHGQGTGNGVHRLSMSVGETIISHEISFADIVKSKRKIKPSEHIVDKFKRLFLSCFRKTSVEDAGDLSVSGSAVGQGAGSAASESSEDDEDMRELHVIISYSDEEYERRNLRGEETQAWFYVDVPASMLASKELIMELLNVSFKEDMEGWRVVSLCVKPYLPVDHEVFKSGQVAKFIRYPVTPLQALPSNVVSNTGGGTSPETDHGVGSGRGMSANEESTSTSSRRNHMRAEVDLFDGTNIDDNRRHWQVKIEATSLNVAKVASHEHLTSEIIDMEAVIVEINEEFELEQFASEETFKARVQELIMDMTDDPVLFWEASYAENYYRHPDIKSWTGNCQYTLPSGNTIMKVVVGRDDEPAWDLSCFDREGEVWTAHTRGVDSDDDIYRFATGSSSEEEVAPEQVNEVRMIAIKTLADAAAAAAAKMRHRQLHNSFWEWRMNTDGPDLSSDDQDPDHYKHQLVDPDEAVEVQAVQDIGEDDPMFSSLIGHLRMDDFVKVYDVSCWSPYLLYVYCGADGVPTGNIAELEQQFKEQYPHGHTTFRLTTYSNSFLEFSESGDELRIHGQSTFSGVFFVDGTPYVEEEVAAGDATLTGSGSGVGAGGQGALGQEEEATNVAAMQEWMAEQFRAAEAGLLTPEQHEKILQLAELGMVNTPDFVAGAFSQSGVEVAEEVSTFVFLITPEGIHIVPVEQNEKMARDDWFPANNVPCGLDRIESFSYDSDVSPYNLYHILYDGHNEGEPNPYAVELCKYLPPGVCASGNFVVIHRNEESENVPMSSFENVLRHIKSLAMGNATKDSEEEVTVETEVAEEEWQYQNFAREWKEAEDGSRIEIILVSGGGCNGYSCSEVRRFFDASGDATGQIEYIKYFLDGHEEVVTHTSASLVFGRDGYFNIVPYAENEVKTVIKESQDVVEEDSEESEYEFTDYHFPDVPPLKRVAEEDREDRNDKFVRVYQTAGGGMMNGFTREEVQVFYEDKSAINGNIKVVMYSGDVRKSNHVRNFTNSELKFNSDKTEFRIEKVKEEMVLSE